MWATNRLYDCAGVRVQVRCTDAAFGERVDELLGRFTVTGEDPDSSDLRYSLIAGPPPGRRGQRVFHFVYREITRIGRSTALTDLLNTLANDLPAALPSLLPDLYAVRAGIVVRGHAAVLLLGADPVGTARLAAVFVANGFACLTAALVWIDPSSGAWTPWPLPLVCPDTATAGALRARGIAIPALSAGKGASSRDDTRFPLFLPLPGQASGDTATTVPDARSGIAIRAVVAEVSGGEEAAPGVGALSRARAALRMVARSANFVERAAERPALARDLLLTAACFELRRPEDPDEALDADRSAVSAVEDAL